MVQFQLAYLVFIISTCLAVVNWGDFAHSVAKSLAQNEQVKEVPKHMQDFIDKFGAEGNNNNQPQPAAPPQQPQQEPKQNPTNWPSIINDSSPANPTGSPAPPPPPQSPPPAQANPAPPPPAAPTPTPSPTSIQQSQKNSENSSKPNRKNQNSSDSGTSIDATTIYYSEYTYSFTQSSTQSSSTSSSISRVSGSKLDFGYQNFGLKTTTQGSQLSLATLLIACVCFIF